VETGSRSWLGSLGARVDSTICEVLGKLKARTAYGRIKVLAYHPHCSDPGRTQASRSTPGCEMGSANTQRSARRFIVEIVARVRRLVRSARCHAVRLGLLVEGTIATPGRLDMRYAMAARARPDVALRFLGGTNNYSLKKRAGGKGSRGTHPRVRRQPCPEILSALHDPLSLSFDDFSHTSGEARHAPSVERLWNAVAARGDLYRRSYQGDYCVGCEQFYSPAEFVAGGCPQHGTPVERVEEDNWFSRLSAYQEFVDDLISSKRLEISPPPFRRQALAFVHAGLNEISVSRSARRARGWCIPVPGDPIQVVYMWFDALANCTAPSTTARRPAPPICGGP
jgi:hypothetical protein